MARPLPLRVWVPGTLALLALLLTGLAFAHDWVRSNRAVEDLTRRRAAALGAVVVPTLERVLARGEGALAEAEMAHLIAVPHLSLALVVDGADRIRFATDPALPGRPIAETRAAPGAALVARGRTAGEGQLAIDPDGALLRAAFPLRLPSATGEPPAGVLYTETDLGALRRAEIAGIVQRSLAMGALTLLVCLGAWAYFHRTFTRRLDRLVTSLAAYPSRRDHLQLSVDGADELARIGQAVGSMAAELAEHEAVALESEGRFRVVADSVPVMIWMDGPDKLCTYVNKRFLEFTGRTLEQECGKGWVEDVHPDDRARCLAIYTSSFDARRPFEMEYRVRRHDGTYRWVVDRGVPRTDSGGAFAGYIGACVDTTERRQAEDAVRTSQERKTALFNGAVDALITIDRDGLIQDWNPAAEAMFGWRQDEALGRDLADLVIPEGLRAAHRRGVTQALQRGPGPVLRRFLDTSAVRADGTVFPVDLVITRIQHEPPLFAGFVRDITERKQTEAQLTAQLAELRRWQAVMLDRSDRTQELKREVNALLSQLGQPPRYAGSAVTTGSAPPPQHGDGK